MPNLVLVRHGESTWNAEGRFTGWIDVDLTAVGEEQARQAGRLLAEEHGRGLDLRVVHTSVLTRAVRTANLLLDGLGRAWLPVRRHWRLNERHYGALQGLDKKQTAAEHGVEQVKLWRRSYDVPPPPIDMTKARAAAGDPRYFGVPVDELPATECLKDVVARMLPYWADAIAPDLLTLGDVLVAAHGNSIRALRKHLDAISDGDIVDLEIPTGVPRVYRFDDQLRVIDARDLGDPGAIAAAAEAVRRQATP